MTKGQFIQELQSALEGMAPPDAVRENVQYYENFIRTQMEQGRSEEEVLRDLGSPRLIAKTILDAGDHDPVYEERTYYDEDSKQAEEETGGRSRIYTINSSGFKIGCALVGIVFLLILFVLFKIIFMFLGPILAVGLILYFIGRFRRR